MEMLIGRMQSRRGAIQDDSYDGTGGRSGIDISVADGYYRAILLLSAYELAHI